MSNFWHPALPVCRISQAARGITHMQCRVRRVWHGVGVQVGSYRITPHISPARFADAVSTLTEAQEEVLIPSGQRVILGQSEPGVRTLAMGLIKAASGMALLLSLAIPASAQEPCKVNVTTCKATGCAFLPGIGPSKGATIEAAHPTDEAALDAVPGIGEATLAKIRPFVTYTGETTCTSKQTAPRPVKDGAK